MNVKYDVLIVGTGVSGLYSALNLRTDLNILVITKSTITNTNTYLAQGGISTARNLEDIPLFIEDTMKAGKYKNKKEAVEILAKDSMCNIKAILDMGINLDRKNGELLYTREGAHSINRIVHHKDTSGKALADTLIEQAKRQKNITIWENTYLADILTASHICVGGIAIKEDRQINIHSKCVILATGGIGGLFNSSTNRRHITGDGISIAMKHNIAVKNLDYIQFHPTALYDAGDNSEKFLISEAVRGEGGKLYNTKGERFIDELLPRDVVSEAINKEIKKSSIPYVFLDISFLNSSYIKARFPSIYKECLSRDIDITKKPIPVCPAQHYFMGGIDVDLNSKTSIENLYAVGETSCTGVHGANRLASNSLLEGLVFSRRAALAINGLIDEIDIIRAIPPCIKSDINALKLEKQKSTINIFKRRVIGLNDELFSYR
ncbi:L-aspartate oxidase [Clostridium omnivorum]|uniref:L-aspartate oxidase n=1 Tax=Clostridium omnivorum TaxID=1604902 RepID=A0ABQ5N4A2_9CLOT|nr:L-aspartate oxidase [Clostridium sp. E14]GLC30026.1 L-aspartate oxidase [Clostridium sp. E14]